MFFIFLALLWFYDLNDKTNRRIDNILKEMSKK